MWEIFTGSIILSLIHASIPNHWLPLIAVSKAEKWNRRETLWATFICGASHTLSTILIGIAVGLVGFELAERYMEITEVIAPAILVVIGVVYIFSDFISHDHHHHSHEKSDDRKRRKTKATIITSLSFAMFITPCFEIEAYYFRAGTIGWTGILIVSAVYLFITVGLMLLLVSAGIKGSSLIRNTHFLEHHERLLTGLVLVTLGILAFLVEF